MSSVSALDAKNRFDELLDRVANGEEIVITRHDKPIARMAPEYQLRQNHSSEEVREAVEGLFALQKSIAQRTGGERLTDEEIQSAIDEGRL
jgi:prevent-host-death family protein